MTCEVCGRGAHLRLGKRYALTLCRDHEYLVGERHPDDGRIRDPWARHVGGSALPEGYDDPATMKDGLLRMWSNGDADMRDIQEILADVASVGDVCGDRRRIRAADRDDEG